MNFADGYYKKSLIQKLTGNKELLAAFCAATNMPLVECSPETFLDQVFVLESEDILKDFARPYLERKLPVRGIKFAPKDKLKFFTMLLSASIDEIVYIDKLGKHFIQVSDIVRKNDFSNLPKEKRPVENPQLLLSGIYFSQELARAVPPQEKKDLKDLFEEFMANLRKATLLLPFEPADPVGNTPDSAKDAQGPDLSQTREAAPDTAADANAPSQKQMRIPLVKTPKKEIFMPVFTDLPEFTRFSKGKPMRALATGFEGMTKLLVKEAKGFMLNPAGFHIMISRGPAGNPSNRAGSLPDAGKS